MKIAMRQAVKHFESNGLETNKATIGSMQNLVEAGLAQFFQMRDIPLIVRDGSDTQQPDSIFKEMTKSMFGKSKYSFAGLFFCFLYATNGLIPKRKISKYLRTGDSVRKQLLVSVLVLVFCSVMRPTHDAICLLINNGSVPFLRFIL